MPIYRILSVLLLITSLLLPNTQSAESAQCSYFNETFTDTATNTWAYNYGTWTIKNSKLNISNITSGKSAYADTSFLPSNYFSIDVDVSSVSALQGEGYTIYPYTSGSTYFSVDGKSLDGIGAIFFSSGNAYLIGWDTTSKAWYLSTKYVTTATVTSIGVSYSSGAITLRINKQDTTLKFSGSFTNFYQLIDHIDLTAQGSSASLLQAGTEVNFDNVCADPIATAVVTTNTVTLVSPANGATSQSLTPTISWSATGSPTAYRIFVATDESTLNGLSSEATTCSSCVLTTNTATTASYTFSSGVLQGGTKYYWRVKAGYSSGSVLSGNIWSFTTASNSSGGDSCTATLDQSLNLNIPIIKYTDSVSGNIYFWADLAYTSNPSKTLFKLSDYGILQNVSDYTCTMSTIDSDLTIHVNELSYGGASYWLKLALDTSLSSGTDLYFYAADYGTGTGGGSSANTVTLLSPTNGATNQSLTPTISWSATGSPTAYRIFVATDESTLNGLSSEATTCSGCVLTTNTSTTASYTFSSGTLQAETKYYWRVKAGHSSGSVLSNIWSFTTTGTGGTTTTIGTSGGFITASDGSKLTISSGALSSSASFTFNKTTNDKYFTKAGQKTYNLTGSIQPNTMTLVFKVESGLTDDEVGLVAYNPSTFATVKPAYSYNSSTGEITVNISKSTNKAAGRQATASDTYNMQDYPQWLVESKKADLTGNYDSIEIPMPYYHQFSGTCWAAAFSMLEKGYGTKHEIYDWLYALQIGPCDGIGLSVFNDTKSVLQSFNGNIKADYITISHSLTKAGLDYDLISVLDKGYPLVFRRPEHVVLVIGYKKTIDASGKATHVFINHDPKGTQGKVMYTTSSILELVDSSYAVNPIDASSYKVLWIAQKPDNQLLQTMVTPDYQSESESCDASYAQSAGKLQFILPAKSASEKSQSVLFQSTKDALLYGSPYPKYRWVGNNDSKTYKYLSGSDVKELQIGIQGYNADPISSPPKLKTTVTLSLGSDNTILKELTQEVTIQQKASGDLLSTQKIPLCEIRQLGDSTIVLEYLIKASLVNLSSNKEVDSFSMNFKMDRGPSICDITPASGKSGDTVTINGHFGATQDTVTFNGTTAKVTSWSDTQIKATVPTGATTGKVVVTVGGVVSNGATFTVTEAEPTITKYEPKLGPVGTVVTITGTGFGTTKGTVIFAAGSSIYAGKIATVTNWTETQITTTVPTDCETGGIVITTADGMATPSWKNVFQCWTPY